MRDWPARVAERLWRLAAWPAPEPLVYWGAMRVAAHATTGKYSKTKAPRLTLRKAIGRGTEDKR